MPALQDLRPSPIAGTWYQGDPAQLRAAIDAFLDEVTLPQIDEEIVAVISPHAGHIYSGQVAAYAFAAIQSLQPDLVVVVSPMHQPYPQPLITSGHEGYQTPLGKITIDHEIIHEINRILIEKNSPEIEPIKYDREHAVEIELPFLQCVFPHDFHLVPIMVRDQSPSTTAALGSALAASLEGKQAVVVASTDLSHFYPEAVANKLDHRMLDKWVTLSIEGMYELDRSGSGYACGLGAVAAVMQYAILHGASRSQILSYATSAAVTGDTTSVVGYASAAILK